MAHPATAKDQSRRALASRFAAVRADTRRLIAALGPEDMTLQSMPEASPAKWHLAHTTWFFETFILIPHAPGYCAFNAAFAVLFNSYYQGIGPQWARAQRGQLSRPDVATVLAYREAVEQAVLAQIETAPSALWRTLAPLLELGINHEQQHQELLCTDIKHAFSLNPLLPAAMPGSPHESEHEAPAQTWIEGPEGLQTIGAAGTGFTFDNEHPSHKVYLTRYALASRPVTNAEVLAFIEDGGYRTASLWLAEGWERINTEGWHHPLYWTLTGDGWQEFALGGPMPLDRARPACHLSAFEAAAFATWAGARLPTEAEWEAVASAAWSKTAANWLFSHPMGHPTAAGPEPGLQQLAGDVWEWTQSAYGPYPGFAPAAGAVGEYNGKFMINQLVLRGGSCLTPAGHCRPSYRNFFPAHARWQMSGIRLAKDL
jgi:ergothioneine biosynthesis protein EgtB